ncbi:MAG: nucleotide exchange factor GrpE [Patescibacteria group bacterium]|jgi:molecular chaperone GrpE|nr:nucleotide exchange factor GrpE [Patescibacteria group bacterium]
MIDKNSADQEEINDLTNSDKELVLLKQKAQEYLDGWKRAKADYSNFKKEQDKRIENIVQFANAGLLAELLPIFDHFKLAIKHVTQDQVKQDWVLGFIHIKKQFDEFLGRLGIKEIETVGQKFDPQFHEAVSHEEYEGFEPDIIFEEVKAGYTLHDKVINPAKVKVAK